MPALFAGPVCHAQFSALSGWTVSGLMKALTNNKQYPRSSKRKLKTLKVSKETPSG